MSRDYCTLDFRSLCKNPFIVDMLCCSTHLSKPPQDLEIKDFNETKCKKVEKTVTSNSGNSCRKWRPTSSTQNCVVFCCRILWSRSPPLQYSITIHRRSSAEQTQSHCLFRIPNHNNCMSCNKRVRFMNTFECLPESHDIRCFILDSRTASLLEFSNLK